jgi:tetratricopeptide (TPR) repeat protein
MRVELKTAALAKITRPVFSEILLRKRLFRLLERDRHHSAIWISGPPGSGKTVLVSSFIESLSLPCLWYQVDCRDENVATFFYYMGLAVDKASSSRKWTLPLFTSEYASGLPAFIRYYFEQLYRRLKSPFYIVFDNYQDVALEAQFHEVIRNGIEMLPEGVCAVFISRREPPGTFARLRANNALKVLGWKELALMREESGALIRRSLKGRQPVELVSNLHHVAGGWMAGLTLMIEKAKKEAVDFNRLRVAAEETIFEYFASELFEKLDDDTRTFLLKTAIMPVMDSDMAERLTGTGKAGLILSYLFNNNYFIERRFDTGCVYQYHPLFREFLLWRASNLPGDVLLSLRRKAALILYEAGRIEDAFGLFRDCSEWQWMERLIMEHGRSLINQGRGKVLEDWVRRLPEDVLNTGPWLQYNLGICHMPFSPSESRSHLERALVLFRECKDRAGVFLSWAAIVDSCIFGLDNLKLLDGWIPELDGLVRSFGGFPSVETEARVAASMFAALIYRQPQHPEIESWGKRALELSQEVGDARLKALSLSNYAFHKLNSGKMKEAAIAIDSCRRFAQTDDATPLAALTTKWVEAMYLTYTACNEDCRKVVSSGLELASSTGAYTMNFLLLGQGTLSALDAGDFKTAEKFFGIMNYLSGRDPLIGKGYYRFLLAYNAVLHGDFRQAATHVDMALNQAMITGFPLAESFCRVEYAHVMHELKERKKALQHLREARRIAKMIKYIYMEFICHLTDAQFAFDSGKERAGLAALRKGMALGRDCEFMNTYTLRPKIVAGLCMRALQAGIETDYVQALIRKRNFSPETLPADIEDWPWAIKIFTLGEFSIERDGKTVGHSRKAQQRPINILKALIALGGDGVKKEKLADILWPEAEGDSQNKAFAIALHRLRRLLGDDNAVRLSGGRVKLDARCCWVDIWAFEHILGKADRAIKEGDKVTAVRLLEKAAALYHGPFLVDDDEPFAESIRERLRGKFLKYMRELGRLYEDRGEFDKAADSFEKSIEAERSFLNM